MTAATATRELDVRQLVAQVGRGTVLSVSGGRIARNVETGGVILPCGSGYTVEVDLAANDTYTVRRVFSRAGRRWVKGERAGVYCDQVGEVVYRAGMFRDEWAA